MNESADHLFDNIKFDIDGRTIDPEKRSFWVFLSSLILFVIWTIFITFYLSRIAGPIISFFLNRYLRFTKTPGCIYLSSLSLSLLSGKLMFREFVYANDDYSIRINDGWIIFSYWRYVPGRKISFKSNSSRLHISLNGLQLHCYNRIHRYKEIAKLFRMEKYFGEEGENRKTIPLDRTTSIVYWDRIWALVGVIKLDIWSGRLVVGNRLLPYMFVVTLENMTSKVCLRESAADCALLHIGGQAESVRASFLKHPDYQAMSHKEPPRTMGDGFAILQSASLHFFYHQDILGYVTDDEQSISSKRPVWESIWRFGHNTVISYGPWAEHQRALIYAFFFAPDYQTVPITELPKRGKRRIHIMHDMRISLLKETSIDIWFMRNEQLESIQNRCQPGSTIDMSIWWITREEGFSWSSRISLLNVESTTSLFFRKILESETLKVDCEFSYPRVFNARQNWSFKFSLSKATIWFVWDHKRFFTDLINEWVGDAVSDLSSFIPYTVIIDAEVSDSFEAILLLNESNWVDPSEKYPENVEAAIVGEKLHFSFSLPFVDFLPDVISVTYRLSGDHGMALRMKYPPSSATASIIAALFRAAFTNSHASPSVHGTHSKQEDDWYEIWRTESVVCVFTHVYHPICSDLKSDLPNHIVQEFLPKKCEHPIELANDSLHVEIEIDGSEVKFTGLLIKFIIELKNNYFGFYDSMTDINAYPEDLTTTYSVFNRVPPNASVELYRPMEVTVSLCVHNIRAQCLVYAPCENIKEICPVFYTEELIVEIKKSYSETLIQVSVGACAMHFEHSSPSQQDGFLSLSGLSFRGHAMFSHLEVPWDMACVEYSWIMEILVGEVKGYLDNPSQVIALLQLIDSLLLFVLSKDDAKVIPERYKVCQHGQLLSSCTRVTQTGIVCEEEGRLKYCQLRVAIDGIQLVMAEECIIIEVNCKPIRFTLCNAHDRRFIEHICIRIPQISAKQALRILDTPTWLECSHVVITGISIDLELPFTGRFLHLEHLRNEFIHKHDFLTRRLNFLWDNEDIWRCACFGGAAFFTSEDTIGKWFLDKLDEKFFTNSVGHDDHSGIFQRLLDPDKKILRGQMYSFYPQVFETPLPSQKVSEMPSLDTVSFYSAMSKPANDGRLSASQVLMDDYTLFLNHYTVVRSVFGKPYFGQRRDISKWVYNTDVKLCRSKEGLSGLRISAASVQNPRTNIPSHITSLNTNTIKRAITLQERRFAIYGSVASSVEIFFTPLAMEAVDRLINALSHSCLSIHPSLLLQMSYRECVFKEHYQPLTESLFLDNRLDPVLDVSLQLPRLHMAMFQCGLLKVADSASLPTENMIFILLDKAFISSANMRENADNGTMFSLHSSMLSSQLLQFTPRVQADFSANRISFHSIVNWEESQLAQHVKDREPRVVLDFQIPDVEVSVERRKIAGASHTTVPPAQLFPIIHRYEHKMKVEIGTVNTLFIMPRPLEMTARNEFPLYDMLSPTITSWLHVIEKVQDSINKLTFSYGALVDMKLARMLKLALDCTDEKVLNPFGKSGKNLMGGVKELGRHHAGCPSCLLLHTLLRWCALPASSSILSTPVTIRSDFTEEKARKTALMALLSHWHPDICQQVKLVSNSDARKYRIDPGNLRKEIRIDMDDKEVEVNESGSRHNRTESAASRVVSKDGNTMNVMSKRLSSQEPKVDLYHWLLSAHRERKDRKLTESTSKDYINPMDIMPQAFFYCFYQNRRLDWTQLDGVPLEHLSLGYALVVNNIYIGMVEQKLVCSPADTSRKFLTPHTHQLVHVKKVAVDGDFLWRMEMDDKRLMPLRGWVDIKYSGLVENVRFVVALSSVCLIKEVSLLVKTARDTFTELKRQRVSTSSTPLSLKSSGATYSIGISSIERNWDEMVLDMMRDFEKNMQRTNTTEKRGYVMTAVRGSLSIDSIRLESILTDLYVSLMIQMIELTQDHNIYDRRTMNNQDFDTFHVKLRKASLALMESDKLNQNLHIINCLLHESSAVLHSTITSGEVHDQKLKTSLRINLGAIEGELPMAAHSLHDVVMRHGPQLEQQLNRLSAHPPVNTNPLLPTISLSTLQLVDTSRAMWTNSGEKTHSLRTRASVATVNFSVEVASVELRARLLPSLLAKYRLNRATSNGVTGEAANWTASIDNHHAEFCVSSEGKPMDTFTLDLPAVAVNGQYTVDKGDAPHTNKQLLYREGGYLKMTLTLGQVNHSFTTDLLNQILFAEQSFRSELSALIQRIRGEQSVYSPVAAQAMNAEDKPQLLFFLTVKGQGVPWLQLTAATPTATAVRFTIDSLETELTNRWVVKEERSTKERLFGAAVIQFNAKLGQLVKVAQYEEIQAELQEYATFMTQIRVENKESSAHMSYSYHISLNRPILLIKSSAIDKAILLWLNYKNTYDYWRAERSRVVRAATKRNSMAHSMFSPQPSQDFDINLSLAINNGMHVCMPLYSQDPTDGMPALVLSLQKSDVTVCIKKELACQATFHGFKLNFIDNFDEQSLSESFKEVTGDTQTNFFFFPQGTYQLCSQASSESGDAKWVLSIRSQMRGMIIDLDQRIGKLAKILVNTFSLLGEEEEELYDDPRSVCTTDEDEEQIDGAGELKKLRLEERVPWMERKMHEQSTLVSDLVTCKASEKQLEMERRKLRQYELIRFKEFRRSMIEKLRRRNDRSSRDRKCSNAISDVFALAHFTPDLHNELDDTSSRNTRNTDTVNMNIDVQVSIESGRCTLRTAPKQEMAVSSSIVKKPSARDLRAKVFPTTQLTNCTRFSIPSVDLKGYYLSFDPDGSDITHILSIPKQVINKVPCESIINNASNNGSGLRSTKRGCFYLSVALSSMPSETLVTPHLADYFEQVLEPLPVSSAFPSVSVHSFHEPQEGMSNIVAIDTSVLPLDVLFYLTVQSSTIRFDGQQQRSSAADCLLKLPCLSLMASTRRTDEAEYLGGVDISATLSAFSLSIYSPHQQSTAHDALSLTLDHLSFVISRNKNSSTELDNRVRFVLTSNIGVANFNYDMRRLSELIAFPKPWYRAAIARRVLFGDQSMPKETLSRPSTIASHSTIIKSTAGKEKAWSATVLLAVQWKELNVNAQMSNTMGNTSWKARRGLLRAFAKLNSRLERDVKLMFKLDSSELTAHGGAISGEIALSQLLLSASHKRLFQKPPQNNCKVELRWLAARVEWMSRAILIGRCESPSIALCDEFGTERDSKGTVIRATVSLNVKGAWDDLQIVITRGTVDDIQKIINKLNVFFQEQLKSSKRVWGITDDNSASHTGLKAKNAPNKGSYATQHWEKVLDIITEIQYKLNILPMPKSGDTVVGGTVELEAGRVSLACMHGEMNAHSWAVFHIRHPSILFSPEAKFEYIDKQEGNVGVSVHQKLIIRLGQADLREESLLISDQNTENMATVCRVQQSRNSVMRQNASIAASLDYLIGDVLKQIGLVGNGHVGPATTKAQHSVLELFQFPALEAVLTTDQMNECDIEEKKDYTAIPEVRSSFICDFHNAVYVQTDFNAQVSFLPELLKSYIQVTDTSPVEEPIPKTDARKYRCERWIVDPKIRFIDRFKWNPPVIDEVLKKLQIFDHRTTIPKALQRAVLDPLDGGLAVALGELLRMVDKSDEDR